MDEKIYYAKYTDEALVQLDELDINNQEKILTAINLFEHIGTKYKNINRLDFNLYEIKPTGVRAYFKYDEDERKVIIIGFICLKKTKKAPRRYMEQAVKNIDNYKRSTKNAE